MLTKILKKIQTRIEIKLHLLFINGPSHLVLWFASMEPLGIGTICAIIIGDDFALFIQFVVFAILVIIHCLVVGCQVLMWEIILVELQ